MTDKDAGNSNTPKTYTEDEVKTLIEKEKAYATKYKEDADGWKNKADKFKDIDLDKYHSAIQKLEQYEKDAAFAGGKEKIDELIANKSKDIEANLRSKYQGEIDELKNSFTRTSAELNKLRVITPSVEAAIKLGLHEEMVDVFADMVSRDAFYDEKTGKVFIKGEKDGESRYSEKNMREVMGIEEYVEILKTKKGPMFKSDFQNGAGNTNGSPNKSRDTSGLTLDKWQRMTPQERNAVPADVAHKLDRQLLGLN